MKNRYLFSLALMFLSLSTQLSAAEDDKTQAKKLQQMQRRFAQEKSGLEAQIRDANGKLAESGKKADEATERSAALGGRLKRSEDEKRKLGDGLAEARQQVSTLSEDGKRLGLERDELKRLLATQKATTATCEERSAKLYQYGEELLGLYVSKGTLSGLAQMEPFTGVKRIEVENAAEDYRDKLNQVKPALVKDTTAATTAKTN